MKVKIPKPLEERRQEEGGNFWARETSGKVWEKVGSLAGGRLEEGLRSRENTSKGV